MFKSWGDFMIFSNRQLANNLNCQPLRNSLTAKKVKKNANSLNQAAQNLNKATDSKVANKLNYVV